MDAPDGGGAGAMPDGPRVRRRRRRITLAIAFALLAVVLSATLSRAHQHRTGTNGIPARGALAIVNGPRTICQAAEQIPAGTAAVRIALMGSGPPPPPAPSVVVSSDAASVGSRPARARWEGSSVVVPLARALRDNGEGDVCIRLPAGPQHYELLGIAAVAGFAATEGAQSLPGRVHLEYLTGEASSWWSAVPTLARRLGRGHAWSGPSVALLAMLLMIAPIALAAWQLTRDEGR